MTDTSSKNGAQATAPDHVGQQPRRLQPVPGGALVAAPMTLGNASALLSAGRSLLRDNPAEAEKPFVIDLSAVGEADSSALTVLLALLRTARETGHTLQIRRPPAGLFALAELYGLAPLLPFSGAD
ncbi:MAG: STAS domain-containing protein [Betaproteobacteria bacterium]|nr:STAS domain-containing protein [Betaproteobacteria bacterium]